MQTLTDKYLLSNNIYERFTVSTDGIKTTQTLLKELFDGLNNIKASLGTNELIHIIGIRDAGGTWFTPNNPESYVSKNGTLSKMAYSATTVTTGGNVYIRTAIISSTLSENTLCRIIASDSGNTYVENTSDVPETNKLFVATYQRLTKL